METKEQRHRISVEVELNILIELKKRALLRNMTLKRYINALVVEQFAREDQYHKQG